MAPNSELDTMKAVENVLSKVEDPAARNRVLRWAWDKFSTEALPPKEVTERKGKPRSKLNRGSKGRSALKTNVSILKDLNLSPKGKKSFRDFEGEKEPKGHPEQCTVAVYYLQHELNISGITPSHIFTCYRDVRKWRLPSDLVALLRVIASRKGWINTSNIADIKVTSHGVNFVEQDLPKKHKK